MVFRTDGRSLFKIVWTITFFVKDAVTGAVILGPYTPYLCTMFKILPKIIWNFVLPSEKIDTVTLTDTT